MVSNPQGPAPGISAAPGSDNIHETTPAAGDIGVCADAPGCDPHAEPQQGGVSAWEDAAPASGGATGPSEPPPASKLDADETEMWVEFKKTRDLKIREKLILKYAHFVKYVAGRIKMHLPDHIEFEDLVSWGTFGLINAVDKYDIAMNIKFVTYSTKRIRGAIIDGLRLLDWVPRGVRSQSRQLNTALDELEIKLGREPEDAEIAEHLKITRAELEKLYDEENRSLVMSLDEIHSEDSSGETVSKYQLVENIAAKNPELSIESDQVREVVIDAINKLSQQEKLVITLYYYNELTIKEISAIMSLSDSRVSQLHTKSILRLRGRLSRIKKEIY